MDELIVSAEWVAERLGDIAVVDVRDAWEFDGIGHIPGAVNVPFDSFRDEDGGDEGMLPGADAFSRLMQEAGIARGDHIVAYDDTHGVFAARFLVTAQLYGHDPAKLHLLSGDFSSWQLEHETTSEGAEREPSNYEATIPDDRPLIGADEVAAAIGTDTVIVDTREQSEFEEGHIEGAVQFDWRELVDDETRGILAPDEATEILESKDIVPEKSVILYCNTARRISHTYLVLRWLGFSDISFYEGSLTEWERRGMTIETGS
ncbi:MULTISPECIES: sulfurtransferase [unclassified Haladaptatus]|uniref:sulfurtransferase n=1 Tax=unclassified Haladaptatus TaxID=2622732 RepID=UPI0023E86022|nr:MULTISPECIES: sulfurtransferase [unclassified Haladaptatus]